MEEKITMQDRIHDVISDVKFKAQDTKVRACRWIQENPDKAITYLTIASIAVGIGVKVIGIIKPSAAELHEKRMDKTYYDPSTGMHWDLKRNLTNSDRIEILDRKRDGEYTEDILTDMKLLKR